MCSYDVYCFGKIFLELITGKLDFSAGNDSTMKDWMETSLAYIVSDNEELVVKILDPSLILDEHLLRQVWLVAFVAKACLSPTPSKRPQMAHILVALEHIASPSFTTDGNFQHYCHFGPLGPAHDISKLLEGSAVIGKTYKAAARMTSSGSSVASRNHAILEAIEINEAYPNGEILAQPKLTVFSFPELKDATRNFRTLVGVTQFGTPYQAWLHEKSASKSGSGSVIAVRTFYSLNMEVLDEWQSQVHLLGSLSHPNIVKVLGYCLKDKELFLVHELMQNGSLENHLFKRGSATQALSWDMRLKILIGAAQGLAFLHASSKQGFYEYFEPSDILLDGSYKTKILGFGIAKINRPKAFDDVHPCFLNGRTVYASPEYRLTQDMVTGSMNVENDVYGFGVVLVETLTGLSGKKELLPRLVARDLVNFFRPYVSGRIQLEGIMDSRLQGKYPLKAALNVAQLGLKCLDPEPKRRPSMTKVVETLEHIESALEKTNTRG